MKVDKLQADDNSYRALPRSIWMLGFVSLFMDASSELVHSLLPIFLTSVLGASMITVGIIEGLAEAVAAITKVFSGAISDYFGKRKILAVFGYGLAALSKPVFPLATTVWWVFAARFVDRIGKGVRGAPRDALVADITPANLRGAAYGLRQALDSVGAFIGPALAVVLMLWFTNNIQAVLWIAVIPAVISVLILLIGVQDPVHDEQKKSAQFSLTPSLIRQLPRRYWLVIVLGAVFTLARFSEAFLILRAQDLGLALSYIPIVMVIMNVVYAGFAYPAGAAADHYSARTLLLWGLGVLVLADFVLAVAGTAVAVLLGAGLWGLHMALTQGLLAKLVADTAPVALRGTAFGIFNLITGIALLQASVLAGWLWSTQGASATFIAGAIFAAIAALGLLMSRNAA